MHSRSDLLIQLLQPLIHPLLDSPYPFVKAASFYRPSSVRRLRLALGRSALLPKSSRQTGVASDMTLRSGLCFRGSVELLMHGRVLLAGVPSLRTSRVGVVGETGWRDPG